MTHSFTTKCIAAVLLLVFALEIPFVTPAAAATTHNLPFDELDAFELIISEDAHMMCDELNMDVSIPANTMVTFTTEQKLSSKTSTTGMEIPLRVAYDVIVDGQVIIPAGALATGRVIEANKAKIFGKPGYLSIGVERIEMSGGAIPMSGPELTNEGDSKAGIAWVCFGVSLIILWPLIFIPFCIKGSEAEIPAGTRLSAYTTGQYVARTLSLPVAND